MNTQIYSVFPACGKTWLCKHQKDYDLKILDSDSSEFSWIRSNGVKERNPDFPNNYIKHIKENIGKYDYIFVSSHASVREALDNECIDFAVVYPSTDCFAEWVGRCFIRDRRGETGCNPGMLYDNWTHWINECVATGRAHNEIILESHQHLSNVII